MAILNSVRVGAVMAQAVIDAVERVGQDLDIVTLRLNAVRMLQVHAEDLEPDPGEEDLLAAYRAWLDVAADYYGADPQVSAADYVRAAGRLEIEGTVVALAVEG